MKKGKLVSQVMAVIGILSLVVTLAQAGSGNGTGGQAQNSFFACHNINGTDLGLHVNVTTDELGFPNNLNWNNVRIGNGVLACTPVVLFTTQGASIAPLTNPDATFLKCYNVAVSQAPDGRYPQFNAIDAFTSEIVQASNFQLLCGPSLFNGQ